MFSLKDIFYEKKPENAIQHVLKPKWLNGVNVVRRDGFFKVDMWDTSNAIIIKDSSKFVDTYRGTGNWDRKELNMLGSNIINITTDIKGLDTNMCFSLSKDVLLNRICKDGTDSKLFVKYDDSDDHGVLISKYDVGVKLSITVGVDEEVIVNGMSISMESGPVDLIERYGKPASKLLLSKSNNYREQKSATIDKIYFRWGNAETKYILKLDCDITRKELLFEIIVRW